MPTTLIVPDGLEYVGAAFLSTVFLLATQTVIVGQKRKSAGVPYPQVYAEKAQEEKSLDAKKFNCAQRAHQNTLEALPLVAIVTLTTASKYPIVAAAGLGSWVISRISYTRGYITGDPSKRGGPLSGVGTLVTLGLLGSSIYIVGSSILSKFL